MTPEHKAKLRAAQARRREHTDDALLEAAISLLGRTGTFSIKGVAESARCSVGRVYFGRYSSQHHLIVSACALYLDRLTSPEELTRVWSRLIFWHAHYLEDALERARVRLDMAQDDWQLRLARAALSKER